MLAPKAAGVCAHRSQTLPRLAAARVVRNQTMRLPLLRPVFLPQPESLSTSVAHTLSHPAHCVIFILPGPPKAGVELLCLDSPKILIDFHPLP